MVESDGKNKKLAELEGPNNSFIFVLGAGVKVLYGICVMRTELIDNLPSYCDTVCFFSFSFFTLVADKQKGTPEGSTCR